jgi:heme o synthase
MKSSWKIPAALIRVRLSVMVTFSALIGFLIAPNQRWTDALLLMAGVFFLACGTSALNQIQERRQRPLNGTYQKPATGNRDIFPKRAAGLMVLLMLTAGSLALALIGWAPLLLGIANIFFYNALYTPLKPRTALAILPGALVGAIPPVMGWTAAGGALLHPTILYIAAFMFLWQLPHFWLLLVAHAKDYERAGFKGFPKFLTLQHIRFIIFSWTLISSLFLFSFPLFGIHFQWAHVLLLLTFINISFIALFYFLLFHKELNPITKKPLSSSTPTRSPSSSSSSGCFSKSCPRIFRNQRLFLLL